MVLIRAAVEYARPAHRDIMRVLRVQEGTEVIAGAGFPMGVDDGIVFFYFRIDELKNRLPAFQMELHAAFKLQGAAAPDPGGQAEPSPAALA